MQQQLDRDCRLGLERVGDEGHVRTRRFVASQRRVLAGGELGPDRGHVLVKLGNSAGTTARDPVEGSLPDMAGHPESGGGQRRRRFSHI
jgi:hypothetical protein